MLRHCLPCTGWWIAVLGRRFMAHKYLGVSDCNGSLRNDSTVWTVAEHIPSLQHRKWILMVTNRWCSWKGGKKNQIIAHVRQGGENNWLYLTLYFIRNRNIASSSCGTIKKNLIIITSNKWVSKDKAVQVKLGKKNLSSKSGLIF